MAPSTTREQGLIISIRNKQHYHLLWEEWRAPRRGRRREVIVNAAANSHLQKGAVLGLCLWLGLEGLPHSSSQVEAFCVLEVGDSSCSSGTSWITWRCRLWLCRMARNSFLLVRDRGEQEKQQTDYFVPAFIFQAFYEAKKTVPGRQICYPYISEWESNITCFYVQNKKGNKITDCVINHR